MKAARYSDSQIMAILKQAEAGSTIPDLYREHGMSTTFFYNWRAKFGGMDVSMTTRMKELEDKNKRLKKMHIEAQMQADVTKEPCQKSGEAIFASRNGSLGSGNQSFVYSCYLQQLCN